MSMIYKSGLIISKITGIFFNLVNTSSIRLLKFSKMELSVPPTEMFCIMKRGEKEGYESATIPVPIPVKDEVLIKVTKVALCGSDIVLYNWDETAKAIASLPFIPGHEATGVVVGKGPEVKSLSVGDRIAVENHFFCGGCYQCKIGRGDICINLNQYGHGKGTEHGGCSQYSIVSEKYCYKLQYDITDLDAVLLEPMGVAHNGIERLDVAGEHVLVIGCGPVGLFAIACAKSLGATRILAADIVTSRLELAQKMGADVVLNPGEKGSVGLKEEILRMTDGVGIGRICEASGSAAMLNGCFSYLRKGGHVTLIGLPKSPLHVDNPMQDILFKSLTLNTVHGRRIFHTWEQCERLIAEKKVDASLVVSHQFELTRHKEAFDCLLARKGCKIVLDPQQ